jgi:hypothetical protein
MRTRDTRQILHADVHSCLPPAARKHQVQFVLVFVRPNPTCVLWGIDVSL